MSQGPRHINTDRSLNRPTEQRPTEASALHQVSLSRAAGFLPERTARTPAAGPTPPERGRRTRRQRRQSAAPARGPR